MKSLVPSLLVLLLSSLLVLLNDSSLFCYAQSVSSTSSLLIDGSALSSNVCYSNSPNLRRGQLSISTKPSGPAPILNLASGPKTIISCIDVIEVQTGPTTPSDLCSAKASLSICSGPLGSSSITHTDCQEITSFYTAPKTQFTLGGVNNDDREWSIKYDGNGYSAFCFPRNVQVVVFSQVESAGTGSIALLVICIVIIVAVLGCGVWYFWYQQSRQMAKAEFDNAVNVMPRNDNPDANDEIIDNNNNNGGDEMMDQPPGLPIEMEGGAGAKGGNFSPRNIQENYLVDDGPQIFSAGPIASIYGSDIQQDMLSIGRGSAAQRGIHNQQGRSPSRAGSKYRIMPEVNVMPLQPLNPAQLNAVAGRPSQSQLRVEPSQASSSVYQQQQQLQDDNGAALDVGGATMTICADCGVNIDAEECPQVCDITGKAHY
jgi:hypothetical protein